MEYGNFNPHYGSTTQIAAGTSAASSTISTRGNAIAVTNSGTQLIFFRLRLPNVTTAASAADVPVLPNQRVVVRKQADPGGGTNGPNSVSVIAPGGAGSTVYLTVGDVSFN